MFRAGSCRVRLHLITTTCDRGPVTNMSTNDEPSIVGLVIPVYVVSEADSCPSTFEDVLDYVFNKMWDTGEVVRFSNVVTFGG